MLRTIALFKIPTLIKQRTKIAMSSATQSPHHMELLSSNAIDHGSDYSVVRDDYSVAVTVKVSNKVRSNEHSPIRRLTAVHCVSRGER